MELAGTQRQTNKQSLWLVLADMDQSGSEGRGNRIWDGPGRPLEGGERWGWGSEKVRERSVLSLRNRKCKGPENNRVPPALPSGPLAF